MFRITTSTLAVFLLLAGSAQAQVLTGTVTYREQVVLPPSSEVLVTLQDVSRADAPPAAIAVARIEFVGQPPIPFALEYDPAAIHPGRRYAVRARIFDRDRLIFTTTTDALVLTQGRGTDANLVVRQVATPVPPAVDPVAPVPLPATPVGPGRARVTVPGLQAPAPPAAGTLDTLPATFAGTLPCDGCPGTRVQLNLFADDSFVVRATDQTRGATPHDALGSWALSSDGRILVLREHNGTQHQFLLSDASSLRKLDAMGQPVSSSRRNDLRRASSFQALEVSLTVQGVYRVTGDAGLFTECSTGRTWMIAETGAVADLESRYMQARARADDAVLVRVQGRLADEPRGLAVEPSLVVERVEAVVADGPCATRFTGAPLERTRWHLAQLGEDTLKPTADPDAQPHVLFDAEFHQFSGAMGCTRFIGRYDVAGEVIVLEVGGTMRTCAGSVVDTTLSTALDKARTYRVTGRQLTLFDEAGELLVRFDAGDR